jgi:transcriptional regulator with XRE-family HTH domain
MLEYDRDLLGQYLKSNRKQANLTQAQVSKHLGYTTAQFVSNIERGISVVPLDTLARMVKLYKVNPVKTLNILLDSQEKLLLEKFKGLRKSNK